MSKYNETDIKLFENKISMEEFKRKEVSEEMSLNSVTGGYIEDILKDIREKNEKVIERIVGTILMLPFMIIFDILFNVGLLIANIAELAKKKEVKKELTDKEKQENITKHKEYLAKMDWLKKNKNKINFDTTKLKKEMEDILTKVRVNKDISYVLACMKYEKELNMLTKELYTKMKQDVNLEVAQSFNDKFLNIKKNVEKECAIIIKNFNNINNLLDVKICLERIYRVFEIYCESGRGESFLSFEHDLLDQGMYFDDDLTEKIISKYGEDEYQNFFQFIWKNAPCFLEKLENSVDIYESLENIISKIMVEIYDENNKGNK